MSQSAGDGDDNSFALHGAHLWDGVNLIEGRVEVVSREGAVDVSRRDERRSTKDQRQRICCPSSRRWDAEALGGDVDAKVLGQGRGHVDCVRGGFERLVEEGRVFRVGSEKSVPDFSVGHRKARKAEYLEQGER